MSHAREATAMGFLQYQFSRLEGIIILRVSLGISQLKWTKHTRNIQLKVLLRKTEIFTSPEYRFDLDLASFPEASKDEKWRSKDSRS